MRQTKGLSLVNDGLALALTICHRTNPTVSASSLTTIAWWPIPARAGHPRPAPGRPRRRAGTGEHGGQDADAGRFRAGKHRRRRCAARWWDGRCSRLRGQGAIHPGDLPAQLPVGACPSTRPREASCWPGPGPLGPSPLTIDGLDHLETYGLAKEGARHHGYTGKRGYHPLLAIAAGTGDVLMSRLREGRASPRRRPLPAGDGGTGALRRGQRTTHATTAGSTLMAWYPSAVRWMSASPSPSASTKACGT